jgi:hypothetical protein
VVHVSLRENGMAGYHSELAAMALFPEVQQNIGCRESGADERYGGVCVEVSEGCGKPRVVGVETLIGCVGADARQRCGVKVAGCENNPIRAQHCPVRQRDSSAALIFAITDDLGMDVLQPGDGG